MKAYVMEFMGTFFLVFAVGLTGNPLAIGLMLAVMIYAGGHISGAHYNPAVTLAVWLRGKLDAKEVAPYWLSQIAGAFAAALIIYLFTEKTFAPVPAEGLAVWKAVTAEVICTFALATVVLSVATARKLEGNYIYGLAIGLTVTACAYCVGSISGGAFNPAVAIGPMVMDVIKGGVLIGNLWIYVVGCLAGGALAAYGFKFLNTEG